MHRFDGNGVVDAAKVEVNCGRLAEFAVASSVEINNTSPANRNMHPVLRRLCRAAEEFFKFPVKHCWHGVLSITHHFVFVKSGFFSSRLEHQIFALRPLRAWREKIAQS